jgi:DNA-binding transcriptional MerR regulator
MKQVERERGRKYVGLPEFAQTAERVLTALNLEQERGTVTSVPDERTIRYYLAEGLIQPPEEKQGTASVFGYLHLLQLVAVKKLQAEHFPIRQIRELVGGKNEQQLESLLAIGGPAAKKSGENEASRYLESLLTASFSERGVKRSARMANQPAVPRAPRSQATTVEGEATPSWQRLEIEPGLELHIRSDYSPPETSARSRSLVERIRSAISRYWRKEEE